MAGDVALGVWIDPPAFEPAVRRISNREIKFLRGKIFSERTDIPTDNFHSAIAVV